MSKPTYYITTPIYYPSDKLHIGHSYTTVAADAMARYKRMKGYDVMFLTGTDEHGQKIQRIAEQKGVEPKAYVDDIVDSIQSLWRLMKISHDRFIRTTDPDHEQAIQKIFRKLYDQGDIYKSTYEGWYCTPCESFWTQSQKKGDQCPDCGRELELTKEESYFFRLSRYRERLMEHIQKNPSFIRPESRKNEMINNFLDKGLEDLCVSRTTFDWGVKVDFDEDHVVYVWIDALSNYITALGYSSDDESAFARYWPADVHLVGKEIVRFHTIIWPCMLMALGLPLPKQVFGHGWLVLGGGKMSKSKGNVVDPVILVDKYGLDAIRYFLLREVPFGSDGLFSNEALIGRINADLANDLGNLLSRTVAMIRKYFDGVLPEHKQAGDHDDDLINTVLETAPKVDAWMDQLEFSSALSEIWKTVSRTNKYIDQTMPWVLAKNEDQKPRLAQVLYNLAESLRIISVLIEPYMVETPAGIRKQLGIESPQEKTWESAVTWGLYNTQNRVQPGEVMFPRIDTEAELEALASLDTGKDLSKKGKTDQAKKQKSASKEKQKAQPVVSIDEFSKIQLRTATVERAEKIEGADKLLCLQLKVQEQTVQVVSGIADFYKPEELVGKKVIWVANLKPVKIRGVQSEGMILAASNKTDLSLLTTDKVLPDGTKIT